MQFALKFLLNKYATTSWNLLISMIMTSNCQKQKLPAKKIFSPSGTITASFLLKILKTARVHPVLLNYFEVILGYFSKEG